MPREIDEWIGKTPDARIPDRVRLRIWDRCNAICQCGCGWAICAGGKWDADHIIPLIAGGENRESNLQVLLRAHHKEKTARDVAEKSRTYRKRKSTLGIRKPRSIRAWRRFSGEIVYASKDR